jgi:hypothetical protein
MIPIYQNLTVVDKQTICNMFHLPMPTPDVTFEMIIAQEKIHPADLFVRLERSRDLRAMIAAAALRGRVKRCPDDAQLHPKPYPKAPIAKPKDDQEKSRQASPASKPASRTINSTRVLLTVKPNPKREGSAARDRYALYKLGQTEAQLLELGLWRSDFRHDTQHGFITWSD